jgi:PTS system nitrogen regulatory IIA component
MIRVAGGFHDRAAVGVLFAHDPHRHFVTPSMSQIADLLPASSILVDLDAGTKSRLFDAVGSLFETQRGLVRSSVVDSLMAREKLGSTGLGQGIAIPHGRIKGLKNALGAFVRLRTPIDFDAPDGKPVGHVFVLLVPEHATEQHLQLLSELAQMFSERRFREQLGSAPDPAKLHALFAQWTPAA